MATAARRRPTLSSLSAPCSGTSRVCIAGTRRGCPRCGDLLLPGNEDVARWPLRCGGGDLLPASPLRGAVDEAPVACADGGTAPIILRAARRARCVALSSARNRGPCSEVIHDTLSARKGTRIMEGRPGRSSRGGGSPLPTKCSWETVTPEYFTTRFILGC